VAVRKYVGVNDPSASFPIENYALDNSMSSPLNAHDFYHASPALQQQALDSIIVQIYNFDVKLRPGNYFATYMSSSIQ